MFAYADKIAAPAHAPAARSPDREPSLRQRGPAVAQLAAAHRANRSRAAALAPEATGDVMDRLVATGRGLPGRLKKGVEALSGLFMDDVRVHRNSPEPAALGALAYTRGSDIHLGPGQEEHLPHEAWHVVQQKQGRVSATAQMKGVGINDDAGLEAEADRMGDAALSGHHRTGGVARTVVPAVPAVQRKVELLGSPLKKPEAGQTAAPLSPLLEAYIAKDEGYVLRDDFQNNLTRVPLHLIDKTKVYIIGEEHDKPARWATETAGWSKIPKMTEHKATMPLEKDDTTGLFIERGTPMEQPLESIPSHLLLVALRAHAGFVDLIRTYDNLHKIPNPALRINVLDQRAKAIVKHIEEIVAISSFYTEFNKRYDANPRPYSYRLSDVRTFSRKFVEGHLVSATALKARLDALVAALGNLRTGSSPADPLAEAGIAKALNGIKRRDEVFRALALDVTQIVGVDDDESLRRIREIIPPPPDKTSRGDPFEAVRPARDREMAANVLRAKPPLLVRTGYAHVPGIAANLGPDLAVPVPLAQTLASKTEVST